MNFLDLGWQELVLILVVVLIVFGPAKVTEIGKTLGRTVRAFKRATSNFTAQMTREIEGEHSSKPEEKKASETDKLKKS